MISPKNVLGWESCHTLMNRWLLAAVRLELGTEMGPPLVNKDTPTLRWKAGHLLLSAGLSPSFIEAKHILNTQRLPLVL